MCTTIFQAASSCGQTVKTQVHTFFNQIGASYNCLGKKVTDLTNRALPEPYAYYAQCAFWTLPYTIALVAMPRLYSGISIMVLTMISPETVRYELGQDHAGHDHADNFYAGIRNACLIHAAVDSAMFATTLSGWSFLSCIYNIYTAAQAHIQACSKTPLGQYVQSIQRQ